MIDGYGMGERDLCARWWNLACVVAWCLGLLVIRSFGKGAGWDLKVGRGQDGMRCFGAELGRGELVLLL